MAPSSTPKDGLRQRNVAGAIKKNGQALAADDEIDKLVKANVKGSSAGNELEYKIGLAIITILAFATRFWGISHPAEVVFDEVHFGKVGTDPRRATSCPRLFD